MFHVVLYIRCFPFFIGVLNLSSFFADELRDCPGDIQSHPDDPSEGLPKANDERAARMRRGPYQPFFSTYPMKTVGQGKNSRSRSFNAKWYETHAWLEYSKVNDAAYCFPCRIFVARESTTGGKKEDAFISTGFSAWQKASERFSRHETSSSHQSSMDSWDNFKKETPSVASQLDEGHALQQSEKEKAKLRNREYMTRLIDLIRTLAKSGRPLRGHNEKKESDDKGLFLEIFALMCRYDPFLQSYIESAPKNCSYLSKGIQNDLLEALNNVMLRKISADVTGKPVSLIADETSDVKHHEQMSIVLRYIPDGGILPIETFVGLYKLEKTDAESIFKELETVVSSLRIDWKDVTAVCFDGASAMSGEFSGVQARCKEKNPSIMYVHCYGHCLNLALVAACVSHKDNPIIFDFFGIIQLIYNFIERSPIRHSVFENLVKLTNSTLKTLKSLSETRWACRAEAVSAVWEQLPTIIAAIETVVETTKDAKVRATGKGILAQVKSFDFIISLEIMHPILQMIVITSKTLQSSQIDLCEAMQDVENLALALVAFRNDEKEFDTIYEAAKRKCDEMQIPIPEPKRRKVSVRIDNSAGTQFHADSKKDEIKLFTFLPLLDSLLMGINERFLQESHKAISAVSRLLRLDLSKNDLALLAETFDVNEYQLTAEVRLLKTKSENQKDLPLGKLAELLEWLNESDRWHTYKSITTVLRKFSVIPVTSCSCERSFSKLVIVKTKLRSTMVQNRLKHAMMSFVEKKIALEISFEEIIEEFKRMVPFDRRMPL